MSENMTEWMPVVSQTVGVIGQASDLVQMTVTLAVMVVILAALAAWTLRRQPPKADPDTVPADVLVAVTEEFARQVQGLREAVDALQQALSGCRECPYYHAFEQEKNHADTI